MKRLLLLSFILLGALGSAAQEWAPVGASWYYTEQFFYPIPIEIDYIKIESVKDTLIAGIPCRKLVKRHNPACCDRPLTEYMYSENNKVYFYDSAFSTFQVLYDFGAETGESWSFLIKDYMDPTDTDTMNVVVDSTEIVLINGFPLKRMYVTYHFFNETDPSYTYNSTITERLGDESYMFNYFPEWAFGCDGNFAQGLRCYEDSVIGHYESGIVDSCTYVKLWTGVRETGLSKVRIYPNPAQDKITVQFNEKIPPEFIYDLYTSRGVRCKTGMALPEEPITVSGLAKGLYLVRIWYEDHYTWTRFIIE